MYDKIQLSPKAGQILPKWGRFSGIDGYQIQYSLYSSFKKAKTVKVGKYATTKKVIKGLKAKKKYYVRIRVYKGSYYSAWSKAKTVVTK